MYRLEVNAVFSAAHAIMIAGRREPLHGHDWHVTATIAGDHVDADGLLVDFHLVQSSLNQIVGRWHNRNLNDTSPFDRINPTAELVCKQIADELQSRLSSSVVSGTSDNLAVQSGRNGGGQPQVRPRVLSVRVTEAVGCAATYFPNC